MFKITPQRIYSSILPEHITKYDGPVSTGCLTKHHRTASICYDNQIRRCYTKTNPRYKDNGAKGIEVLYSKSDFIAWYLHEIKLYTGTNPSVGRIDHSKSYSFDNIRIESLEDNSMERIIRCGTTKEKKKIHIINFETKEIIKTVDSVSDAEKETGVKSEHISKYCKGILGKSKNGFTFKYVNELEKDNIKEFSYKEIRRLKSPIVICDATTLEKIYIAYTAKEITNLTDINKSHLNRHCRGEIKRSTKGYTLRYWSGNESELPSL